MELIINHTAWPKPAEARVEFWFQQTLLWYSKDPGKRARVSSRGMMTRSMDKEKTEAVYGEIDAFFT